MKKRRIVMHERTLIDLELRSEYIRQHNPQAALRFLDAAEASIRQLAALPGLGRLRPRASRPGRPPLFIRQSL